MRELRDYSPGLLEQAPTTETHKHWGQEVYIADSPELQRRLSLDYARMNEHLCLKVFKTSGEKWGGVATEHVIKVQNLFAFYGLAPRVYELVTVNRQRAMVTEYATGEGKPDHKAIESLIRHYRIGLKGKPGNAIDNAVEYSRLPFKWIGDKFVDWGRFHFTDPTWYQARLVKKLRRRNKGGKRVSYQPVPELNVPGQRNHAHRMRKMRLDEIDFHGKTVLDIGCNTGAFCREALRRGANRVVGIDHRHAKMWYTVNNWLGYHNLDILQLTLPEERGAIEAVTGLAHFDIVFALAIAQHMEGGYQKWIADLTDEVLFFEGNWHEPEETYRETLESQFGEVELTGYIKDEDVRCMFRCWKDKNPTYVRLGKSPRARRASAVQRGMTAYGRVMLKPDELRYLYDLATVAPNGDAVEVGLLDGSSLICWEIARRGRGVNYGVDIDVTDTARRNVSRYQAGVQLIQRDSAEFGSQRQDDAGLAFVFIDADHTKTGIPRDIAAYAPAIMPGGIIAFHDYDADEDKRGKGYVVKRTVDAWQKKAQWEPLGVVGRVAAFRKPGGVA